MQNRRKWRVADVSHFVDTWDEDEPGYAYSDVTTKAQLEEILKGSMSRIGTVLHLQSDDGVTMGIGLSDTFGWLTILFSNEGVQKLVRPRRTTADSPCLFRSDGVVSDVFPINLIPANEVIQAVLFFFETSSLPETVVMVDPSSA